MPQHPVGPRSDGAVPPRSPRFPPVGHARQIDAPRGHVVPCLDDRPSSHRHRDRRCARVCGCSVGM